MEVIYTGLRPERGAGVEVALQEAVDCDRVSILVGSHVSIARKLYEADQGAGAGGRAVVFGGTIPEDDIACVKELGVHRGCFPHHAKLEEISTHPRKRQRRGPGRPGLSAA